MSEDLLFFFFFFFFLENTLILGQNRKNWEQMEVKTFFLENTLILGEK